MTAELTCYNCGGTDTAHYEGCPAIRATPPSTSTAPKVWIKHLTGAECKPDGRCYDIAFAPMPGYTEYSATGVSTAPMTEDELIAEVKMLLRERAHLNRGFGKLTTQVMELTRENERLRAALAANTAAQKD